MPETIGHVDGPECFLLVKRAAFSTIEQKVKHEFSTRWARLLAIAVCTETNVDAQISPAHYTNPHGTAGCALLHTASTLVTKVMPQLTNIYLLCW